MFVFREGSDVFGNFPPSIQSGNYSGECWGKAWTERISAQLSWAEVLHGAVLISTEFSVSFWTKRSGTVARRRVISALLSRSHHRAHKRTSREQQSSKSWYVPTVLATYTPIFSRASHIGLKCRVPLATVKVWECNTGKKERKKRHHREVTDTETLKVKKL
jgi:hypothetical protein